MFHPDNKQIQPIKSRQDALRMEADQSETRSIFYRKFMHSIVKWCKQADSVGKGPILITQI